MKLPRTRLAAVIAAAALMSSGCLIRVEHVANADGAFREAFAEADRYTGHGGRPSELNVLVYDSKDGEMVRVSVPIWLANKFVRHAGSGNIELEASGDENGDRVARALRRSLRDGQLSDLSALPKGVVASVESDDERVLVWMR
jgi:hypothetical protein